MYICFLLFLKTESSHTYTIIIEKYMSTRYGTFSTIIIFFLVDIFGYFFGILKCVKECVRTMIMSIMHPSMRGSLR